jgi:hypothetical protein
MIRLVLLILCQSSIQEEFQKFVNFDIQDFDLLRLRLENLDKIVWLVS